MVAGRVGRGARVIANVVLGDRVDHEDGQALAHAGRRYPALGRDRLPVERPPNRHGQVAGRHEALDRRGRPRLERVVSVSERERFYPWRDYTKFKKKKKNHELNGNHSDDDEASKGPRRASR